MRQNLILFPLPATSLQHDQDTVYLVENSGKLGVIANLNHLVLTCQCSWVSEFICDSCYHSLKVIIFFLSTLMLLPWQVSEKFKTLVVKLKNKLQSNEDFSKYMGVATKSKIEMNEKLNG